MGFSREETKMMKGIAIILMLYHHLFAFPERFPESISYISTFALAGNTISYWIGCFGKICVALYLFLGGYGTYLSAQKSESIDKLVGRKIKNLYLVYWKVFLVFIPLCMALNVSRVTKNVETLIWNFTGLRTSYNGEWWFFTPYVILLVLFPLLYRFLSVKKEIWIDLVKVFALNAFIQFIIPVVVCMPFTGNFSSSLFWSTLNGGLAQLPVFAMGCFFAKYDLLSQIKRKSSENYWYFGIAVLSLPLTFYMRKKTGYLFNAYDLVYAPLIVISASIVLENKLLSPISKVLIKIGNQSTIIWLTHSFYCYMLCPKIVFLPRYAPLIVAWLCLICYVTALAINALYKKLYEIVFLPLNKHIIN